MTSKSLSPLRELVNIISSAVDRLESIYEAKGVSYPFLDGPFDPQGPGEVLAADTMVSEATTLIIAAANHLTATVNHPAKNVLEAACGFHLSSSLRVATVGYIPEILREGGDKGVHVKDIAAKNGLDAGKISRVLRLLATHHIFREVSPDVFTNNRHSSMLDTGKSSTEIKANPTDKFSGAVGLAALTEHTTDECFKASAYMTDIIIDPKLGDSEQPNEAALQRAFNTDKDFWRWLHSPGNEFRQARFNVAMDDASKVDGVDSILKGFPWASVPEGGIIVDVGGGIGSASLPIAKAFPKLKVIIQDREPVVKQATGFWIEKLPGALESRAVTLQAYDFFKPQPVTNVDIFMLRRILHDWATSSAAKILRQVRAAATPGKTKLLIVERVIPYTCEDTNEASHVPGVAAKDHSSGPLLANLGQKIPYMADMQMLISVNGQERTVANFVRLAGDTGWKVVHVYAVPGSSLCHIVAEPV